MKNKFIFAIVLAATVFPSIALAQGLIFSAPKTSYHQGDTFAVSVKADTNGKSVNTVSGTIRVSDGLSITDVRTGNSLITLWVQPPKINAAAGTIDFAGGIPGGYSGSSGPIFDIVLKAMSKGIATINYDNSEILLNDGEGTELSDLAIVPLKINVTEVPKETKQEVKQEYVPPADIVPPESFMPLVSRDASIANNKYFASFSAIDKGSGIDHYELREVPTFLGWRLDSYATSWRRAESPYVLEHQLISSDVEVRAYDRNNNVATGVTHKPVDPVVYKILGLILLVIILFEARRRGSVDRRKKSKSIK
jgi:hypothetical protein